ncbi:MAG: RluA family pseudouridine synthase, partial [Spirochaetales bacterium]|nr:RluA family pseudouridine synthase [Candidatus Physcosoma equi]
RFHTLFPSSPEQCHVHRLDMDTSGLLVLAFHKEALKNLSLQFEKREVQKTYVALLEGVITETEGDIDLPMRLDTEHRPMQIVDMELGKPALTHWERISVNTLEDGRYTRVRFFPHTGRTHQLRVHAASGLHHPIKGDNLYGHQKEGERLALHAESITFRHPRSGEMMTFMSEPEF